MLVTYSLLGSLAVILVVLAKRQWTSAKVPYKIIHTACLHNISLRFHEYSSILVHIGSSNLRLSCE